MTYLTRARMVAMSDAECWAQLRLHQYGVARLAFNTPPADLATPPEILPVNYLLDGNDIIVQTGSGVIHEAALHGMPAAVEVDSIDKPGHGERPGGWSVVVSGSCETVDDAAQQTFLRLSHLSPAAGGFKPYFIRVLSRGITGRRF